MKLTLRTLLAYRDGLMPASHALAMQGRLNKSEKAQQLDSKLDCVVHDVSLGAPAADEVFQKLDPVLVAQYLDNQITPEQTAGVEQVCLASDMHLAEVAACSQILKKVISEPVSVAASTRNKILSRLSGVLPELATESHSAVQPTTVTEQSPEPNAEIISDTASPATNSPVSPWNQPPFAETDVDATHFELNEVEDDNSSRLRSSLGSTIISAISHLIAIAILAFIFIPAETENLPPVDLVLRPYSDKVEEVNFSETTPDQEVPEATVHIERADADQVFDTSETDLAIGAPDMELAPGLGNVGAGKGGTPGGDGTGKPKQVGTFFGIEAAGKSIAYVVDASGSMSGRRFERACGELTYSLKLLGSDQEFYVTFFNHETYPMGWEPGGRNVSKAMWPATNQSLTKFQNWLAKARPEGGTEPAVALSAALKMTPDVIFFLTDGEFDESVVEVVRQLNRNQYTAIHTIGFESRAGEEALKKIANQNRGQYRFISSRPGGAAFRN